MNQPVDSLERVSLGEAKALFPELPKSLPRGRHDSDFALGVDADGKLIAINMLTSAAWVLSKRRGDWSWVWAWHWKEGGEWAFSEHTRT